MTIKCVVVEDEPIALNLMKEYVNRTPDLELLAAFNNPILALDYIQSAKVDLVFLDINMPDMTGMELSKYIKDKVRIIFTTAYEDYALEGYKVDAVDYLLKPFDYNEFLEAVRRAKQYFDLVSNQKEKEESIHVRAEHKQYKIGLSTIMFIENMKNYVIFRLQDGSKVIALMSLKSLEDNLPENFFKVHRSFIINLNFIERVDTNKIMIREFEIPVSDSHKKAFKSRMSKKAIN